MANRRHFVTRPASVSCELRSPMTPALSGAKVDACDNSASRQRSSNPKLIHSVSERKISTAQHLRTATFEAARTELQANLSAVDESCQKLTEAVDSLIAQLVQYRDSTVARLQTWKANLEQEIAKAVLEVEATLAAKEVQLAGKYAPFLRNYRPGNLVLFKYQIDTSSVSEAIQAIFKSRHPQPKQVPRQSLTVPSEKVPQRGAPRSVVHQAESPLPQLMRLNDKEVSVFNFKASVWEAPVRLVKSILCDIRTSYLLLDAGKLFSCGNDRSRREAYFLHLSSGKQTGKVRVESLSLMKHERWAPGLLYFEQNIFVFGSGYEGYTSIEVFSSRVWTLLPAEMSCQRSSFSPCELDKKAYLFSSFNPESVDVFDLCTRTFLAPISVQMPREDSGSVCGVLGGEVTIISMSCTARLRQDGVQLLSHEARQFYPASNAVAVGEWLYWVDRQGRAMRGSAEGCFRLA